MDVAPWQRLMGAVIAWFRSGNRWARIGLVGALTVYMSLGAAYAYGTPHLVSYDEPSHVSYALSMWRGELPTFDTPMPLEDIGIKRHHTPQIWVAIHPPLYYALIAPAVGPAVDAGEPRVAVRRARLVSLGISALGFVYIFLIFRLLVPKRPAIAVGGTFLSALLPFFLNVMGAVFNDSAGLLMSSAALYTSLLILLRGPTKLRLLQATVWFGLAGITRLSTVFTLAPAALAIFLAYLMVQQSWKQRLSRAALASSLLAASPLLTSGWWYWRNVQLYDDFSGGKPAFVLFKRSPNEPWHELILSADQWEHVYDQLWGLYLAGYRLGDNVKEIGQWFLFAALFGLAVGALKAAVPLVQQRSAVFERLRSASREDWARAIAFGIILLVVAFRAFSLMEHHARGGTCNARYLFTIGWVLGGLFALGFSGFHRRWALVTALGFSFLLNFDCASRILGRFVRQDFRSRDFGALEAFHRAGLPNPELTYVVILTGCALGLGLAVAAVLHLEPANSATRAGGVLPPGRGAGACDPARSSLG